MALQGMEPLWLEVPDVCAIQGEILAESGGTMGILSRGALESTLDKPKNLDLHDADATLYDLAASYGYGLVKNHCFVDGNKRVALIAVYTFLSINGIELTASEVDAASFFLDLAASLETQDVDMKKLADWLEKNSEPVPDAIG
jgi:death on curing protein